MVSLLIIFIVVSLLLIVSTYFSRTNKKDEVEIVIKENPECCGAHDVCERDNLQIMSSDIEYFDDEELDKLAHTAPTEFTEEQIEALENVFYSMQESDVSSWLKSLQLRNIYLPENLREQAMMIVGERRGVIS